MLPNGNVSNVSVLTRYQIVTCHFWHVTKYFSNVELNDTLLNGNVAKTNEQYTYH